MSFASTENHKRNVRVLAEGAQGKKMTRKVDTWEYEDLSRLVLEVRSGACRRNCRNIYRQKLSTNGTKRPIGQINSTCS